MGGSPTIDSVASVEKGIKGEGPLKIISADSDQLFKDYQPYGSHPELPVFDGELLMDVHGTEQGEHLREGVEHKERPELCRSLFRNRRRWTA